METAYIRGARRSMTRGGILFLCSIQQPRPTRGRPGYMESYPNPSMANGKPSRRPAVTAHMPHVPPEHPNSHSRSATASERLGFTLVTDGLRIPYVPPTGGRYSLGCPPSQQKLGKPTEGYRASADGGVGMPDRSEAQCVWSIISSGIAGVKIGAGVVPLFLLWIFFEKPPQPQTQIEN